MPQSVRKELVKHISESVTIPVIASLGSVGASGGYYAALGAEKIIASPGTLTGSLQVAQTAVQSAGVYLDVDAFIEVASQMER